MIRTVIADDSGDIRMLMRMALELDDRFDVVGEGADGAEALALVETLDPDLLLLDLAMPIMDGLEVLQHLQGQGRPPVVVLSGFKNEDMVTRAMELGAATYITKGRDIDELPDLLADAVGSERASGVGGPEG